jgi:hypothetical protein
VRSRPGKASYHATPVSNDMLLSLDDVAMTGRDEDGGFGG